MAKVIVYSDARGGILVCAPARWSRLCRGVTVNGGRISINPPVEFKHLVRIFKTEELAPVWAETAEELAQRKRKTDVPADALNVRIVDESEIPQDRTFRAAWRPGAVGVEIDMVSARAIQRDRLRRMRKPKLEALDVELMRAVERSAPASEISVIAARKQALRDVTADPAIEAAQTPEALKTVLPAALTA